MKTHGKSQTPLYKCWQGLVQRAIIKRWRDFATFQKETGAKDHERVGREFRNKPLGPKNFRILGNGKRAGNPVKIGGRTKTISEWAEYLGISKQRAHQLYQAGHLAKRVREVT